MRSVASNVEVVAVESVEQIFESNDTLNVLELSNNTLDLVATDALKLFGGSGKSFLPSKVGERSIFLADEGHGKSLFLKTIEGVTSLITDPLFVDFLVDTGENSKQVRATGVSVDV